MIETVNATLGYGRKILMKDISVSCGSGTLIAVLGKNGSGKSTLIRAIAGIAPPLSGKILIAGKDISGMSRSETARKVSFVGTERVNIPGLLCRDVVSMGRAPWTGWTGKLSGTDRKAVVQALEMTGMTAFAEKTMDRMSDGECQRIMIARALAQDTPIMLLDEPTAFLDVPGRYLITEILKKSAEEKGKTVIFSTHDIGIALKKADRVWIPDPPCLLDIAASAPGLQETVIRTLGIPEAEV